MLRKSTNRVKRIVKMQTNTISLSLVWRCDGKKAYNSPVIVAVPATEVRRVIRHASEVN
jgi:hypothetical protein